MKKHHIPFSFLYFCILCEISDKRILLRPSPVPRGVIHTRGRIRGIKASLEGEAVGGGLENAESGKGSRFCRTRENKSA
jgi:hypothetical protein